MLNGGRLASEVCVLSNSAYCSSSGRGVLGRFNSMRLALTLLAVAIAGAAAQRHDSGHIYIVNEEPSFVAVIDVASSSVTRRIPIAAGVTGAAVAGNGRYLYLLHHGRTIASFHPSRQSSLSVVDLLNGVVAKEIPLGWNVERMAIQGERDAIFCLGINDRPPGQGESPPAVERVASSQTKLARDAPVEENPASRWTVDKGVYDWQDWMMPFPVAEKARALTAWLTKIDIAGDHAFSSHAVGPAGTRFLISGDGAAGYVLRLPVLLSPFKGHTASGKNLRKAMQSPLREKALLQVFGSDLTRPNAEIPLAGWPRLMWFATGGRYLYLWDLGPPGRSPAGSRDKIIQVLDAKTSQLAATLQLDVPNPNPPVFYDEPTAEISVLGDHPGKKKGGILCRIRGPELLETVNTPAAPKYLVRPDGYAGRVLVTERELCLWPDGGPLKAPCISVNPLPQSGGSRSSAAVPKALGHWPAEVLYLAAQRRFLLKAGDRVGFIDEQTGRLEQTLTTGRTGVRVAQVVGRIVVAAAMSYGMTAMLGAVSPGGVYIAIPSGSGLTFSGVRVSPDGAVAYALNSGTEDITVIDTKSGRSGDKIEVGPDCFSVDLIGGGRFLSVQCRGRLALLDTATGARAADQRFGGVGDFTAIHDIRGANKAFVFAERGVVVLNTAAGKVEGELPGLPKPKLLLNP